MTPPQAIVRWAGVRGFLSAELTLTQGITPSIATVSIPPQQGKIALDGTLLFTWGRERIELKKCRVDDYEIAYDPEGREYRRLRIMDRRWWWARCQRISGYYNVRRGAGVDPRTVKRPQELAKLLLEAMGERNADVSKLPNDSFPEVSWDYANPAEELSRLCEGLGCRIVLDIADDRTKVVKVGEGRLLPPAPAMEGAAVFDPPDPPGKIAIVTDRMQYQVDILLEPVAFDPFDRKIKHILDLSYTPVVGGRKTWAYEDIDHMHNIAPKYRKWAQQCIYRWFRIRGPLAIPGERRPIPHNELWRILPLLSQQVETLTAADGREEPRPAWIYGRWWAGFESHDDEAKRIETDLDNAPKGVFTYGFSLEADTGIVKTSRPLFRHRIDARFPTGRLVFDPVLYLRTAVNIRDVGTRGWRRFEVSRVPPGRIANPDTTEYVKREELVPQTYIRRARPVGLFSNRDEILRSARAYLDTEVKRYEPEDSATITYPGLRLFSLDGAITQTTWSVADDGRPTTRVSRNREEFVSTASFAERRLFERIHRALAERERIARARAADVGRDRG